MATNVFVLDNRVIGSSLLEVEARLRLIGQSSMQNVRCLHRHLAAGFFGATAH